jgi:hypothetical protein
MVSLDQGADGIVTLHFVPPYGAEDERAYLDALDTIGRLEGPFALLTVFGGQGGLGREGDRAQALWFKATRQRMNAACRGLAMVRPGATEATAATFQKLWTFPVCIAPDEDAARAILRRHLDEAA